MPRIQIRKLAKYRFFLLFVFLLLTLVLYPYAELNRLGYVVFRVAGAAAIFSAVWATNLKRWAMAFVLTLAIPALLHRMLPTVISETSSVAIVNTALNLAFDVLVVILIFRHIFANRTTNRETIFGALCVYILVGFSFASVYEIISVAQTNGFYMDPKLNLHVTPDRFDCVYYSFCTMTSLGATGMAPVTAQARSMTAIEGVLGVLYLAVLIARLMAAYREHLDDESD